MNDSINANLRESGDLTIKNNLTEAMVIQERKLHWFSTESQTRNCPDCEVFRNFEKLSPSEKIV